VSPASRAQATADNAAAASRTSPECRLPAGSYQASCAQLWTNSATLRGQCKNANGALVAAQLDGIGACQGDIMNVDGALHCNKGGAPPAGSYQQSCAFAWTDSATQMSARCTTRGTVARAYSTTLQNYRQCVGDIFIANNALHCAQGTLPPGSYAQSCTHIYVEGSFLNAACSGGSGGMSGLNIATCHQPIDNANGQLRCGPAPLPPAVLVPQVLGSTLAKAKADIQAAGLTIQHMDSSCGGQLDTYMLVGGQSPAASTLAPKGSSVDITHCVPPPLDSAAQSTCAATHITLCVTCPSSISGDKKSELSGYSCSSESDTISVVEQLFGGCSVKSGSCSF